MQLSQPGDVPAWTLADRLRKARDHAKLSQQELAAAIGISRASVSGYEAGYREPPRPVLIVWAMVCHVDLEWLTGPSNHPAGQPVMILPLIKGEIRPAFGLAA